MKRQLPQRRTPAHRNESRFEMYVCLCNAITDAKVRAAAAGGATRPKDVFAACGCGAQCATCTRMMLSILRETSAAEAVQAA